MRKIFIVLIGLLATAYFIFSLAELESILEALRQSKPLYLGAAVAVEAALLLNSTLTFWVLYRLVGLRESGRRIFLMVNAATFVNLVTPSSGIGGMVVFFDEAHRRGLSTGRVTVGSTMYVLYEYASFFVVLGAGFVVLMQRGKLYAVELAAAGFLLVLAMSIGIGLVVGYRSTRQLGNLLAWLAERVNRLLHPFLHKELLNVASAHTFSEEMRVGFSTLSSNHKQIMLPLIFTLSNKLLLILILALAFLAMGIPLSAGNLVAGFSIGQLFVYASPTPSGVGFVDSILPVVLSSMGVPIPGAVLVALVYRAVTLWIPLIFGALAFRYLNRSQEGQVEVATIPS